MYGSTSDEVEELHTQGERCLRFGEFNMAEEVILNAIALDDSYAPLWNLRGLVYQDHGNFEKAFEFFNEATARAPKWIEPLENRGLLEFSKKQYEAAIETFKMYMKLGGNEIEVLLTLVEAAFKKGDCDTVLSITKKIIDTDEFPHFREIWEMRGMCQAKQERFNAAFTSLNVAIEMDPEAKGALNAVGDLCYETENYERASEFYAQSLSVDGYQAFILFRHGTSLWLLNKWSEAIPFLERYTRLVPKDYKGWNNLGVVLREKGEIKRSTECYQKALQIDPEQEIVKSNLGTSKNKQVIV